MSINTPDKFSQTDYRVFSAESPARNQDINELTTTVIDKEHNNPYEVLGLEPDSSWPQIKEKIAQVQHTLKDAKVYDLQSVSLDEANRRVDAHGEIKWAINKLQEMYFQRPEFVSEVQDLPTLLKRLDFLSEHRVSFVATNEGLSSVEGAKGQILNLMREVFANPDIKLLPHNFIMISDLHNERTLFERELPKFQEMVKSLKSATDVASINRVLQLFKTMGYEKIPLWRDGKPSFMSVTEELLRIKVRLSNEYQDRGPDFARIFEEQLKRRMGSEAV